MSWATTAATMVTSEATTMATTIGKCHKSSHIHFDVRCSICCFRNDGNECDYFAAKWWVISMKCSAFLSNRCMYVRERRTSSDAVNLGKSFYTRSFLRLKLNLSWPWTFLELIHDFSSLTVFKRSLTDHTAYSYHGLIRGFIISQSCRNPKSLHWDSQLICHLLKSFQRRFISSIVCKPKAWC